MKFVGKTTIAHPNSMPIISRAGAAENNWLLRRSNREDAAIYSQDHIWSDDDSYSRLDAQRLVGRNGAICGYDVWASVGCPNSGDASRNDRSGRSRRHEKPSETK